MRFQFITTPHHLDQGKVSLPPDTRPPVNYLWLSGYLMREGHTCAVTDAYSLGWDLERIKAEVAAFRPRLVGLCLYTENENSDRYLARQLKDAFPDVGIVCGGYHVNHHYAEVIGHEGVDFCVRGEGEHTLCELSDALAGGRSLASIDGLVWKDEEGVHVNPPRDLLEDLDEAPVLPYELVRHVRYRPWCFTKSRRKPFTATVTSRGCPMNCIFCDIARTEGTRFRGFSAERVMQEIRAIHALGYRTLEFYDPLFTGNRKRVKRFCGMLIDSGIKLEWTCMSTILHGQDEEMLQLMGRAGCRIIFYGVEAGNPDRMKEIKKIDPPMLRRVLKATRRAGIRETLGFILGLPGETKETMEETIALAKELNPWGATFTIATPFAGTELRRIYEDRIFLRDYREWGGRAVFRVPEYTPEYLEETRRRANKEFYFRPRVIFNQLRGIRCWDDLKFQLEMGNHFRSGRTGYLDD